MSRSRVGWTPEVARVLSNSQAWSNYSENGQDFDPEKISMLLRNNLIESIDIGDYEKLPEIIVNKFVPEFDSKGKRVVCHFDCNITMSNFHFEALKRNNPWWNGKTIVLHPNNIESAGFKDLPLEHLKTLV